MKGIKHAWQTGSFFPLLILVLLVSGCSRNKPLVDVSQMKWIHGSADCSANSDPPIQVVQYDATTWILRQNKCVHYEAPFMYLFVGNEKALLMDTGATEDSISFPLYQTVRQILDGLEGNNRDLVVAHSHRHSDHYKGDPQFKGKPNTTLVGINKEEVVSFFGFTEWPNQNVNFDLGDRKITLIPIPGHDEASVAFYDEQTRLLLSGDTFYPGRLYVRDWPAYVASIRRIKAFCDNNPVDFLVGNHIEMKDTAQLDYPTGTTFQPNEDRLPLRPTDLNQLHGVLISNPDRPAYLLFDRFIVVPIIPVQERPIADEAVQTLDLPGYPDFLAVDSSSVWVTNAGYIQELFPGKAEPLRTCPPLSNRMGSPYNQFMKSPGICGAPVVAFGSVWAASCLEKSVFRIDRMSGEIVAQISSGLAEPHGELSLAAGGGSIWILSDEKGVLARINPASNKVIAQIAVKPHSYCASFGYGSVWVTNTSHGTVQRVDPATNQIIATIAVGPTPHFLTAGEGGIWTLNQGDGTVSHIDPASNRVVATIYCNAPGTGGDIDAGHGYVWVRSKTGRMLQAINPETNLVDRIYGPLNGSGAVRVAAGRVWVTAHDVNKVWVIQ